MSVDQIGADVGASNPWTRILHLNLCQSIRSVPTSAPTLITRIVLPPSRVSRSDRCRRRRSANGLCIISPLARVSRSDRCRRRRRGRAGMVPIASRSVSRSDRCRRRRHPCGVLRIRTPLRVSRSDRCRRRRRAEVDAPVHAAPVSVDQIGADVGARRSRLGSWRRGSVSRSDRCRRRRRETGG